MDTDAALAVWSLYTTSDSCDHAGLRQRDPHCDMWPCGLRVLGPILIVHAGTSKEELEQSVARRRQRGDFVCTQDTRMYVLIYDRDTHQAHVRFSPAPSMHTRDRAPSTWNTIPLEAVADDDEDDPVEFLSSIKCTMLRCAFSIELSRVTPTSLAPPYSPSRALDEFRRALMDPSQTFFELHASLGPVMVNQAGDVIRGKLPSTDSHPERRLLCDVFPKQLKSACRGLPYSTSHHPVTLYQALSSGNSAAPTWTVHAHGAHDAAVMISFDAVACVSWELPLADAIAALVKRLALQAKKAQDFQVDRHGDANQAVSTLECVQFPLRGGAVHPIGVWTCDRRDLLPSQRHNLHVHFVQPMDRPVLRRRCQWLQPSAADDQTNADRPLVNIHLGASFPAQSAVPTTHLVQGKVAYYHYLQQGVQDKGWGCAYRSLQTLASWLWLNQYTDVPVPTHREIQDILFKLGDKPPRFVGSRGWIGTVEVGFVLEERFRVSCRTIYCASGRDLPRHAPTLAEHFLIHGSPVMMGGASLAFTIVGVATAPTADERDLPDMWLLVLDPHYSGGDADVQALLTKVVAMEGYKALPVGWRHASSFPPTSFYNLCLPQRPVHPV
ncbi:hypothetical protein H310_13119 [Aphanomyces invadans]|uniref:UFSP1/2/DUB catalytic domain-containing protein n=1 Tax=Aphanomyces invadans TaxID=157072 RepID=A0A024TF91_9STRA|nr:hypothetical protein H310_13119 [Aphanomyces invadans]ETV92679.1 hypothetical protein H310_13119 [Aphanomyces invadans]|eukprot:XP_008878715.1 hypothetical protein H310_13119 [Aphanomyces invadans]